MLEITVPLPADSHHTPFFGTQLYSCGTRSPKEGNQEKGYGMSLQVRSIRLGFQLLVGPLSTIPKFQASATKVTIMGQSAGGDSVYWCAPSPSCVQIGLWRAIMGFEVLKLLVSSLGRSAWVRAP